MNRAPHHLDPPRGRLLGVAALLVLLAGAALIVVARQGTAAPPERVALCRDPALQDAEVAARDFVARWLAAYAADDRGFLLGGFDYRGGFTPQQAERFLATLRRRAGGVTDWAYLGHDCASVAGDDTLALTAVYRVAFDRDCGWGSVRFHLVIPPSGPKLVTAEFVDGRVAYQVAGY